VAILSGLSGLGFAMNNIELLGYIPGAIGRIVELHAIYYHKNWGFGQFFEAKVAGEMSEFIERYSGPQK